MNDNRQGPSVLITKTRNHENCVVANNNAAPSTLGVNGAACECTLDVGYTSGVCPGMATGGTGSSMSQASRSGIRFCCELRACSHSTMRPV